MSSLYNIYSKKVDTENRKIEPINLLSHINNDITIDKQKKEKKQKKNNHTSYEIKTHFKEIAHITEIINTELIKHKSNYRFCIYPNDGEINIDVVILKKKGSIKQIFQQNITHDTFMKWVENILDGEGLIFDSKI